LSATTPNDNGRATSADTNGTESRATGASGNGNGASRGWLQAIAVYRQPRVVSTIFLGFSSGLPFYLVFQTLSAWLRQEGIER
jgi:PAT family beta-lactamase induction signal transducer AmpG